MQPLTTTPELVKLEVLKDLLTARYIAAVLVAQGIEV